MLLLCSKNAIILTTQISF